MQDAIYMPQSSLALDDSGAAPGQPQPTGGGGAISAIFRLF